MLLQRALACLAFLISTLKAANIQFITDFPSNLNLLKGDILKLQLSDYVRQKGAKFDTKPSNPAYFDPSIAFLNDVSLQAPEAKRCTLVVPHVNNKVLMVCSHRYFIVATMDHILMKPVASSNVELKSSLVNTASQKCTDIVVDNNIAYISCLDENKATQTGTDVDVLIYKVSLADTLSVTSNYCSMKLVGDTPRMKFIKPKDKPLEIFFYNGSPYNPTPSTLKFTRCKDFHQQTTNDTKITTVSEDIIKILGDDAQSLTATLKYIHQINDYDILFVLSESSDTIKQIILVILNYNVDGTALTKSKYLNATTAPGQMRGAFNPANVAVYADSDAIGTTLTMADLRMAYKVPITYSKSDPESFKINAGTMAANPLDCGYASEGSSVYVSRISTFSNDTVLKQNLRQVIEYRTTTGSDLKGFAINLYQSEYACSDNSNAPPGKIHYGFTMLSMDRGFATGDDKDVMSYYKIQPQTLLKIDTSKLSEGENKLMIEASLKGYNSDQQELKFNLNGDYRDTLQVTFDSKSITTYSNSKFTLPYVSKNFLGNNLRFNTNASNVIHQYANVFYPTMAAGDLGGYIIDKTFAVDHDTFVAVLTKPQLPNRYITFFGKIEGGQMTLQLNSMTPKETPGIALFKIFKLGNDYYCMVFKSQSTAQKRVTVSCFEDKPDGDVKLNEKEVSNQYEVMDIQFLETSHRVDMLMVAAVTEQKRELTKVLHFYLEINSDKSITVSPAAKEISLNNPSLSKYVPVDVLFDYVADSEGSNHVTIKMISSNSYPIIAKFNMTFQGENVELIYLRHMNIKTNDVAYCINKHEAILYNRKTRQLYSQRFDIRGAFPDNNEYKFPHVELGIQYIIQFLCIPEKGVFQILGVDKDKHKWVVTYRGGESDSLGRRVHSIVQVDDSADFIEHGYTSNYIVTVAGGSGPANLKRAYVQVFPDGPYFYIDNKDKVEPYWVEITAKNDRKTASETVKVDVVMPKYSADATVKSPFEINPGAIMFFEDYADVFGPVMDVQLVGESKDLEQIQVIKRNNKHKGLNIGSNSKPDKVLAKGDFLVALSYSTYIKFLGDPTVVQKGATQPVLIHTENCNVRDAVLVKVSGSGSLAAIVKEFKDGEFVYTLTILRKLKDTEGNDVFIREPQGKVFGTKEDFEDLQAAFLEDDLIISMKSKKELISNYIKLLAFKKETGSYKKLADINLTPLNDRAISSYSLIFIGTKSVALVAAAQGEIGLQVAIWDTFAKSLVFVETKTKVEVTPGEFRFVQIDYLRCWTGPTGTNTVDCIFDSEGITDMLVEVTFDPLYQVYNKDMVSKMRVKGNFEMPPYFNIKRTSRDGDYFTFLLEKNPASKVFNTRRLLQGGSTQIDKWTDCNNLIVVFKPMVTKYMYTAITCSEWNNGNSVDMSTENVGGRTFIFYTKDAPTDPTKVPAEVANERLASNYISGIVLQFKNTPIDQSKVSLKFIGLNGQSGTDNKEIKLDQFKKPSESGDQQSSSSSKAWIWILIIVIVLLAIGAGVFLFLKNRSSEPTHSASYAQPAEGDNTLNSKDDLEDVRL